MVGAEGDDDDIKASPPALPRREGAAPLTPTGGVVTFVRNEVLVGIPSQALRLPPYGGGRGERPPFYGMPYTRRIIHRAIRINDGIKLVIHEPTPDVLGKAGANEQKSVRRIYPKGRFWNIYFGL